MFLPLTVCSLKALSEPALGPGTPVTRAPDRASRAQESAQHCHVTSSVFLFRLKNKSVLRKTFMLYSLLSANPA